MADYITIEAVKNGWVAQLKNDEFIEDDTADEIHVFTKPKELLKWIAETIKTEQAGG